MKDEKYKIIVTSLVPLSNKSDGKTGAMVRLVEILKRFNRMNGFEITAISSNRHFFEFLRENGVSFELIKIKSNLKFKSLLGLGLKSLPILLKSFFVLKLDFLDSKNEKVVLYVSSDLFWEVIPAFYFKTRRKKIRWIQVIHHIYPDWKNRRGNLAVNLLGFYLQRFSFWLIRKKADKIIVLGEPIKNNLVKLGFQAEKIYISSNGVDIDYFEKIKKNNPTYDGIFLGRLSSSKGVFELIDIWKKVAMVLPQARLAVIGGGNTATKKFLAKKINGLNLEKNIDLFGFLEDEEAHPIMKSGKVFLFPSHEEGWGIAIAEAMACGLPVVSWNLPAYKEIFGKHIEQIEENSLDDFAEKTIKLIRNEDLLRKSGQRGKDFIEKYSWDSVVKKELEIIKEP